jgi:hypothetical protein
MQKSTAFYPRNRHKRTKCDRWCEPSSHYYVSYYLRYFLVSLSFNLIRVFFICTKDKNKTVLVLIGYNPSDRRNVYAVIFCSFTCLKTLGHISSRRTCHVLDSMLSGRLQSMCSRFCGILRIELFPFLEPS